MLNPELVSRFPAVPFAFNISRAKAFGLKYTVLVMKQGDIKSLRSDHGQKKKHAVRSTGR
jgi:hypothetical protein